MPQSRRSFLQTAALGALAAGIPLRAAPADRPSKNTSASAGAGSAKNLIFVVSDGMSAGTFALAEQFRRRRDSRGTAWIELYRHPAVRRALMDTASASSLVTDSAAASSSWGGGMRVNNGALNIGPGGERPAPIFQLARAEGRAAGLVTTASITHATPAGFTVNASARNDEAFIADQYLEAGLDLYLGGGNRFFDAARRADRRDAYSAFKSRGYHIARSREELLAVPAEGRLLGVFAEGHIPYSLDRQADAELAARVPTLSEMTELALKRLSAGGSERGFVLQVEGARVDHAAHANDFGALVHEQLGVDDALAAVLRFAAGRDDTLVIVTTDHGNANPGLIGTGSAYGDTDRLFANSFGIRQTNDWIIDGLAPTASPDAIRDRLRQGTGLDFSADEIEILGRALRKEYTEAYRQRRYPGVILGQLLANHIAVGWSGVNHSSDYVDVLALGPGSDTVDGFILNTDLHRVMRRALGLPPFV